MTTYIYILELKINIKILNSRFINFADITKKRGKKEVKIRPKKDIQGVPGGKDNTSGGCPLC
jgi:hypothetical protein